MDSKRWRAIAIFQVVRSSSASARWNYRCDNAKYISHHSKRGGLRGEISIADLQRPTACALIRCWRSWWARRISRSAIGFLTATRARAWSARALSIDWNSHPGYRRQTGLQENPGQHLLPSTVVFQYFKKLTSGSKMASLSGAPLRKPKPW
jgi:hypothetical protein